MKIMMIIKDGHAVASLSKFFNMKNPVDREIMEKIKDGKFKVAVVELEGEHEN